MKRTLWYRRDPGAYSALQMAMVEAFPDLVLEEDSGKILFRGPILVADGGKVLDRYFVDIELPGDFPHSFPVVRETQRRIPWAKDRHVDDKDGAICICVPDELFARGLQPGNVVEFMQGPVRTFFLGNSIFEITGDWPHGQRSHGQQGVTEFYSELLDESNTAVVLRYMEILAKPEARGHYECPCGSGKRLRNCHLSRVLELRRRIPWHVVRKTRRQTRIGH